MKPIIAISMGDYNGIGPEVAIKALAQVDLNRSLPVWIGHQQIFDSALKFAGVSLPVMPVGDNTELKPGFVYLLDPIPKGEVQPKPGEITVKAGRAAMLAVETGTRLCMDSACHALVTAPISKEAISKAGYNFPGHTEFLAELTNSKNVLMMLVSEALKVALSTIHIPLQEVSTSLGSELLIGQIDILNKTLKKDFGIDSPKIAVLGLNPHAGDGGIIGREEIETIAPAIQYAAKHKIDAEGPFAADGFFGSGIYKKYDAVLAMYHDQGLIPFKTLSFGKGVNFTANLGIIRTSPDHGTAFSIAGQNRADEQSFLEAYNLAVSMAQNSFKRTS